MSSMETRIIRIDPNHLEDRLLMPAAQALRDGRLVAFPTETVYGLGADALNAQAIAEIFKVKGRPGDNPLIVHIASIADLPPLVREVPPLAARLFAAFSPGPLTLILPKSSMVPDLVTAGLDTVAIRIPAHPVARRLIELAGVPVAAPSANRSGRPSPTQSWHVEHDLAGRIPYIIDAGPSEFGLESTVVDMTRVLPIMLRPGSITAAQIREITGDVLVAGNDLSTDPTAAPRSPGMKYRHYAPKARVLIAEGDDAPARINRARQLCENLINEGLTIGLFGCGQFLDGLSQSATRHTLAYGQQPDAAAAATGLFDALRRLDQAGVAVIIVEALPEQGIGTAYMNRLRKAAGAF